MRINRSSNMEAEVYATDMKGTERRYPVHIAKVTCSCRKWQITGLPCHHALYFILKLRGEGAEIENFVHEYFSVAKFAATYAQNVPPMVDVHDWEIVNPGFKLEPPILRRPPGRPRKLRIKASHEKGSRLGARRRKCKRCGGLGHIKRLCKNPVPHDFEDVLVHIEEDAAVEISPQNKGGEVVAEQVDQGDQVQQDVEDLQVETDVQMEQLEI